jgi:hypothetical protein
MDPIIALLVALQFSAFGWRINREISVGDEERKTWLPLADYVNVLMLFLTISCCIVIPLSFTGVDKLKKTILIAAVILLAFHPITTAAHYGLLSMRGRDYYVNSKGDYPYATREEVISFILSLLITVAFVGYILFWLPSYALLMQ